MNRYVKNGMWGVIMFLTFTVLPTLAQEPSHKERHEQIEAIKVAFITNKLDLTSEEAQKFWPVYNNYQKELMTIIIKRKEERKRTDISPGDKINLDLAYETSMLELKKKYKKIYSKAIPPEKILLLYQAEREFREHLIKQLNYRRRSN